MTLDADADGNILDNPPLAEDIAQDPLLQGLKLIAWVADDSLLPRLGARGFPHWGIWAERNKAFTKDMVSLMVHNQPRLASQVATRYTRLTKPRLLLGIETHTVMPSGMKLVFHP